MMLYIDAGLPTGITNFNSTVYNGDYAKNFRFTNEDNIDYFFATYFTTKPILYKIDSSSGVNYDTYSNSKRGLNGKGAEMAISWNDLYNLGPGLIPNNVSLKFVSVIAGGFNWGAGDSSPNNLDTDGDVGPDSLIYLAEIFPDQNGDGIPDPTIIISSIETSKLAGSIPVDYALYQNYPNPFNPSTIITFDLPRSSFVELKIFDILGREISTLLNNELDAGKHIIKFSAENLSSGIYFYKISCGSFNEIKKMLFLK
jgi:hypothetical protein